MTVNNKPVCKSCFFRCVFVFMRTVFDAPATFFRRKKETFNVRLDIKGKVKRNLLGKLAEF